MRIYFYEHSLPFKIAQGAVHFKFCCGSRPGNGTSIFAVRVLATGLPVTPLITTYQDTAKRSAGTWWYNGNGRRVVMVGALVRILTAVVYLFFYLFS